MERRYRYKAQNKKWKFYSKIWSMIFCLTITSACEDLLEVDPPRDQIGSELTFGEDVTAEAAIRGIYADMLTGHSFNGDQNSLLALTGLSSDELYHPPATNVSAMEFEENELLADNQQVLSLWSSMYKSIYSSNAIIEGLERSQGVSESTKKQLTGEALFVRAFCHFYLVNLFGEIPIITTTDYITNAISPRKNIGEVYVQVEEDLTLALDLLDDEYKNEERVRPNRGTALALLARVFLYQGNWLEAETMATAVILNNNYTLVDLSDITLSNNMEAIWQLHSSITAVNAATNEGINFINLFSTRNALRQEVVEAFEPGDIRRDEWVLDNSSFYIPYKYKVSGSGTSRSEYSTILRLGEQYLIRAEAQAQQNKISEAISDLDVIRDRAGLPLISETNPGIGKEELLKVIMHERRVELFTEWGHRWMDLKRTGQAAIALSSLKPNFTQEDELYPIPTQELNNNPNLEQNAGY